MAPKPRQKRIPSGPAKPDDAQTMSSAPQQPAPTPAAAPKDQQPTPSTSTQATTQASNANPTSSAAMPPPPQPPSKPQAILEPEMTALAECLKNAVVKTAQVYAFHADAHRLGLQRHMPYPPRSLIASLGSEVERYDQLCDAIEFQVSRAISVLQRDLSREQARIREAENAIAQRTRSKSPSKSPVSTRISLPPSDGTDITMQPPTGRDQSPTSSTALPSSAPARRQSNISLSSLQRPPLPLKLDLSAARMNPDDATNFAKSGLASPVALAPKSARLTSTAEIDLMAAFANAANQSEHQRHIDIDLTSSPVNMPDDVDLSLGTTADKPIELDLDNIDIEMSNMTDLFGDESTDAQGGDNLFSPDVTEGPMALPAAGGSNDTKDLDMGLMDALSAVDASGQGGNSLDSLHIPHDGGQPVSGDGQSHPAPSPGAFLEGLGNTEGGQAPNHSSMDFSNLDFSGLSPDFFMNQMNQHGADMNNFDMDSLLQNMGQAPSSNDTHKPDS